MPERHINSLLSELESRSRRVASEREVTLKIDNEDLIRLKALAEVYGLSIDEVSACLLHQVLVEVEEKMPYRAGSRIIRVEDDDPVYEDIGPTPRYLEAKRRIEQECA
ncbi:hypothetical protein ADIMK_2736 [Marinobacterium lacunae]|uniref:Uncharacterized protein n=1 Tax=Marinobacterium lacunae TaxID=1232683 RepID=A0A081FXF7_9GAMM|nr:hypothetical protein [Marinobacterium lacunae]KEA63212.1 hypothetical protein ADIMK_2736 [Marinobacterium lacunae]MBR9883053.1 hypothetical protein [Oceanospirillales bacterium]